MADLTLKQGDTLPAFAYTCTNPDGSTPDLTGATVKFVMRTMTATAPLVNAAATVPNPLLAQVLYSWAAADTATPGSYMASFVVTFVGGAVRTYPTVGWLEVVVEANLIAAGTQSIVSLAEAKDYLNIPATGRAHDAKLTGFISAATPVIEGITGDVIQRQRDEWYDGGQTFVLLRHRPVVTLSAVSIYQGPVEYPLALVPNPAFGSIYSAELDELGRVVRRGPGGAVLQFPPGPQSVHIVYISGRATGLDNIRLATLELIRVNYQPTQEAGRSFGGAVIDESEPQHPPTGFFVPARCRELLTPSRRAPSVA